jgi:hypothetical protein
MFRERVFTGGLASTILKLLAPIRAIQMESPTSHEFGTHAGVGDIHGSRIPRKTLASVA